MYRPPRLRPARRARWWRASPRLGPMQVDAARHRIRRHPERVSRTLLQSTACHRAGVLVRIAVTLMPEVYSHLASPNTGIGAGKRLPGRSSTHSDAQVVVAHSLGSVVTYEVLHAYRDGLRPPQPPALPTHRKVHVVPQENSGAAGPRGARAPGSPTTRRSPRGAPPRGRDDAPGHVRRDAPRHAATRATGRRGQEGTSWGRPDESSRRRPAHAAEPHLPSNLKINYEAVAPVTQAG